MFNAIIRLVLKYILYFGLHFDNRSSFPKPLSSKEERDCFRRMAEGDSDARNTLIVHNLRLVAYIVKKNYPEYRDQDDLISIGIIGLIRATETFDYTKGTSFSTYASKCADNQIKMHFRKIKRQQNELYLDDPIDTDKDGNQITLADTFSDQSNIADIVDNKIDCQKLREKMKKHLTEREQEIICKRYGLAGSKAEKELTQREVAKELNISRSYVSRIEKKAIEKLGECFGKREGE